MKFIKQLFCKHKRKKQRFKLVYIDGLPKTYYGWECKDCGKVWRL